MKKRINILYQCDNNYAFMAGVSFASLLLNASSQIEYHVYVLTPDMSQENRDKWYEVRNRNPQIDLELTFISASECQREVESWGVPPHRGSLVTYYKLFVARLLDEDSGVDRIIHIGADTLVTGSMEDLADFDFHGKPFAMNWSEKFHSAYYPREAQYCIAEMIYFNLPEWRKHRCEERIIEHVKKNGDIYGSKDQGILCAQFINEYEQLPLKYNIYGMTYYFSDRNKRLFNNAPVITKKEIQEAYSHPEIIHLPRTFLYRPCEEGSKDPLYDMWWEYCDKSPWKGMEPIPPFPPLNKKERFFRSIVFRLCPIRMAEWLYIKARHWSANVEWFLHLNAMRKWQRHL
ncbi:MAG: hypothetical protein K2J99_17825 [Lachnospiraceae bacterium]|nr:hypothetical protein [Lachnospiraceae bacterium]